MVEMTEAQFNMELRTISRLLEQAREVICFFGAPEQFPSVLCVDDERGNLIVMGHALKNQFRCLLAQSGKEALWMLEEHPEVVLVISDQRMPDMTGAELLDEVGRRRPDIETVLVSAYDYCDLKKPWRPEEVREVVLTRLGRETLSVGAL